MINYEKLFIENLGGIKKGRNGELTSFCPFHNDNNRSFSANMNSGLWICHSGCGQGNANQFAELIGIDPIKYISKYVKNDVKTAETKRNNNTNFQALQEKVNMHHDYLLKNWDTLDIPKSWSREYVKKILTGWDQSRNTFTFTHMNENAEISAVHWHKSNTIGDGGCKWYPANLIDNYDKKYALYIVEGEKDLNSLLPILNQVASATTGALTIPKDSSIINGFRSYYILYDNDQAGIQGANKLANHIKLNNIESSVYIGIWNSKTKGYDVSDSIQFDNSLKELDRLISTAEEFRIPKIGEFDVITSEDASNMTVKAVDWIVDGLLPKDFKSVLGGSTGSNKSYFAMELGMRVAEGNSLFLGFRIRRETKTLFIDLEVGNDELVRRFKRIKKTIHFTKHNNFNMLSKSGTFFDVYNDILIAINIFKPDLVIIDNLYTSIGDVDISRNDKLKPVLGKIDELKKKTGCTILLIHHFNKATKEVALITDRMQGAGALQNWMEYCILISKTNKQNLRLMKIAKSRGTAQSEEVYGIRWNSDTFIFEMAGIVRNWVALLIPHKTKKQWEDALESMNTNFTTQDWLNKVECEQKFSRKTAFSWLRELQINFMVAKVRHGHYKKTGLELIDE